MTVDFIAQNQLDAKVTFANVLMLPFWIVNFFFAFSDFSLNAQSMGIYYCTGIKVLSKCAFIFF